MDTSTDLALLAIPEGFNVYSFYHKADGHWEMNVPLSGHSHLSEGYQYWLAQFGNENPLGFERIYVPYARWACEGQHQVYDSPLRRWSQSAQAAGYVEIDFSGYFLQVRAQIKSGYSGMVVLGDNAPFAKAAPLPLKTAQYRDQCQGYRCTGVSVYAQYTYFRRTT